MNDTTPEDEPPSAATGDESAPIVTQTRVAAETDGGDQTEADERDPIVTQTRTPSGSEGGSLGPRPR